MNNSRYAVIKAGCPEITGAIEVAKEFGSRELAHAEAIRLATEDASRTNTTSAYFVVHITDMVRTKLTTVTDSLGGLHDVR